MSIWTALVVVVAILVLGRLGLEKYRSLDRSTEPGGEALVEEHEALLREVADLRQRVAVLERIVTDERRSRAVAEEIEALRES